MVIDTLLLLAVAEYICCVDGKQAYRRGRQEALTPSRLSWYIFINEHVHFYREDEEQMGQMTYLIQGDVMYTNGRRAMQAELCLMV